jgi:signal peptidase
MKSIIPKYSFYVIAGILIVYILVSIAIPEQTMNVFGFRSFVVVSTSMEPDIDRYDMIVVTKPNQEDLEVRDAITFSAYIPEAQTFSYVTHYIGEIVEEPDGSVYYETQGATKDPGDYDNWTDGNGNPVKITFDDIEGQYRFRIPKVGYVVSMLRDPIFVALLFLNGFIFYALYRYIMHIIEEKKVQKKKTDD